MDKPLFPPIGQGILSSNVPSHASMHHTSRKSTSQSAANSPCLSSPPKNIDELLGYNADMRQILTEICPQQGYLAARFVQPVSANPSSVLSKVPYFPSATTINSRQIAPNHYWANPEFHHLQSQATSADINTDAQSSQAPAAPVFRSEDYKVYDINPTRSMAPLTSQILHRLATSTLFHIFYHHPCSRHRQQALIELYRNRYWFWHRDLKIFLHVEGKNEICSTDKGLVYAHGVFFDPNSGKELPVRDSGLVVSALNIVPLESLLSQFSVEQLKFQ